MRTAKTLFIVADGTRARLVRRVAATAHFETFEEMDDGGELRRAQARLRGAPHPVSAQSGTTQRHTIGRSDDGRRAKAAFAAKVAARAAEVSRAEGYERVVVAAPARLASVLRDELGRGAVVAAALTRDLTKAPDAELGRWFLELPPG